MFKTDLQLFLEFFSLFSFTDFDLDFIIVILPQTAFCELYCLEVFFDSYPESTSYFPFSNVSSLTLLDVCQHHCLTCGLCVCHCSDNTQVFQREVLRSRRNSTTVVNRPNMVQIHTFTLLGEWRQLRNVISSVLS